MELQYESAACFPNGEETDQFDEKSLHCLITHKSSGLAAGCVRLVTTSDDRLIDPLPLELFCAASLDRKSTEFLRTDRDSLCEISRLAVDGRFRKRTSAVRTQLGDLRDIDCSDTERRTFSLIAVAGFMSAMALTELSGRRNIFAMMETFLPRLMRRTGLNFERAGRPMQFHGMRAPYFITTDSAVETLRDELREFYFDIYHRFELVHRGYKLAV